MTVVTILLSGQVEGAGPYLTMRTSPLRSLGADVEKDGSVFTE